MDRPGFDALSFGYPLVEMRNYQHVWSYTLLNLTAAALIIVLVGNRRPDGFLTRLLASRVPVAMGRVSYGMYVVHSGVLVLLYHLGRAVDLPADAMHSTWYFACYALTVYALAYCSYRFLESPLLRLKDRFVAPTTAPLS